jgi:hypothetical protein
MPKGDIELPNKNWYRDPRLPAREGSPPTRQEQDDQITDNKYDRPRTRKKSRGKTRR